MNIQSERRVSHCLAQFIFLRLPEGIYGRMTTEAKIDGKIVRLNVGGTRYDVSRDTLERFQDSMLASLVSKHWKEGNSNEPIHRSQWSLV
jgi:hypothetical protein